MQIFENSDDLNIGVNAIIINDKNEFLLGKRENCLGAGEYSLFGGHLKTNERIEDCIKRELYEEIGIIVDKCDLEVVNFCFVCIGTPMIEIGVLVKSYCGEPHIKEPKFCSEIGFFDSSVLPNVFIATRPNLELFLNKKFYDQTKNYYGGQI